MSDPGPWDNCFFSLEIDNVEVARFQEWTGLKTTAEVFEIPEGGFNGGVHKRPGQSTWGTVTLKYAADASTTLLEWRDRFLQDQFGEQVETTGALVIRDNALQELRRYNFARMWPVAWEGPQLASGGSALAVETLEIAFDRISIGQQPIEPPPPPPPPPEPEEPPEDPPEDPPGVIVDDDEIVTMNPVQFERNHSDLTEDGQDVVDQVTETLENHPEIKELWVEGHTCDLGSRSLNDRLSSERASEVADQLQESFPDRVFHADGYAWDYPVRENLNETLRAKNRRTQFFRSARSGRRQGELAYVRHNYSNP